MVRFEPDDPAPPLPQDVLSCAYKSKSEGVPSLQVGQSMSVPHACLESAQAYGTGRQGTQSGYILRRWGRTPMMPLAAEV